MRRSRRSYKTLRVILILVIVVETMLLLAAGAGYLFYRSKVAKLQYNDGTLAVEGTIDATEADVMAQAQEMQDALAGLEQFTPVLPTAPAPTEAEGGNGVFGSDVVNILFIGTDERTTYFNDNARGDSIILCSMNLKTGAIKLVSLERGMGVPILEGTYKGQWDWLTHTFRYGGASLMMREVEECFRLDVNYYVRANIYTFMKAIDAIGGVDISLTENEVEYINYPNWSYAAGHIREMGVADQMLKVKEGENHLNGATTMIYARCRSDSDWYRVERQRKVLQAAVNQVKHLSLLELNDMLDTLLPLVQTNLTEKEITELMLHAPAFFKLEMDQMTIPVKGTYGGMTGMGGRGLFAADFEKNTQILHDFLYGPEE